MNSLRVCLLVALIVLPIAVSGKDTDPCDANVAAPVAQPSLTYWHVPGFADAVDSLTCHLRSLQSSDGSFGGAAHTDGAIQALAAAGLSPPEMRRDATYPSAPSWLVLHHAEYNEVDAIRINRLVLGLAAAEHDPHFVLGRNPVLEVEALYNPLTGTWGGGSLNEAMFALFALDAGAIGDDHDAVVGLRAFLLNNQADDGSWGWHPDLNDPSVDMSAAAIAALRTTGVASDHPAIRAGLDYMRSAQVPGGCFASRAGATTPNVQSTSWAMWALGATGTNATAAPWLDANGDGPIHCLVARVDTTTGRVGPGDDLWDSHSILLALTLAAYPVATHGPTGLPLLIP